jgi:DNA-binding CsgD family transcriptional regulator
MADTGATVAAAASLPLQWPLVGRHDELELFVETLKNPRAHGFVIHGPAGVGKTRLADQCLALAHRAGRAVARATATEGSQSAPLGALAHLLPAELASEQRDSVTVMAEVRRVLHEQSAQGPLVLFVDDLPLLDGTSATLVSQLVDADLLFLVATVRTGSPVPPALDSLWQRARVRRVDLDDLDPATIQTLLHLVLQDPVEAATASALCSASRGNLLFVRELVLGAIDGGHLVHRRGVWRLVGPLVTTPRLHELVAARLDALPVPAAEALDILAVWEPTGLATLEAIIGPELLETLDRSGLLSMRLDGRRQQVSLAHPLYGEILRARMPALRRRRLLLEHADRIDGYGARRREDPVRVATARLDAAGAADPQLLLRAARLARYGGDFSQVERLGRAALADGMVPEAALLVSEALHELGGWEEADALLTAAETATDDEELLVHLCEMRSRNLMWGLHRDGEALEVNRRARDRLRDESGVEELTLNEVMLLTYAGRPREGLAVLEALPPATSTRARSLRALSELPALLVAGQCQAVVALAMEAFAEQMTLPDQVAIPGPGVHILTRAWALIEAGGLADAATFLVRAYDSAPPTTPPDGLMWLGHQRGRCALIQGQLETATRWLSEAAARCEQHNIIGPRRLVLSLLAAAHGARGDAVAASAAVGELDQLPPFGFVAPEQELGRAWAKAAEGDRSAARAILSAAAADADDRGYVTSEAWLLHDVARLGHPGPVADRLATLAQRADSPLIAAYAAHAEAARAGRAAALAAASTQFEELGAMLLAAEAATEAAQAFQRAGDRRGASTMSLRAATLAAGCEGARTPALDAPVLVSPLTPRERDIAALAAQGESSKEIADRLYLSVRTVNNHLQSVYAKLGVGGRRQLAGALAGLTDVSPEEPPPAPPPASSRR